MGGTENTSTDDYVTDLRDARASAPGTGMEYAAAVGLIGAIVARRSYGRYGTKTTRMTDADRLDEIGRVLDALTIVTGEVES
jgi:hypothetical protein